MADEVSQLTLPQVNRAVKPERACNQSNMTGPFPETFTYASPPKTMTNMVEKSGLPALSTYENIRGAYPCSEMAVKVRDPAYTAEFPIERTEIRMMTLMKLSKPYSPASLAAITNGEALESEYVLAPSSRLSSLRTNRPTKKRPRI